MIKGSAKIKDIKMLYEAASTQSRQLITKKMPIIENNVRNKIKPIILSSLNTSDTVQSLLFGTLKDDFGLFGNTVQITITNIVKYISDNMIIRIRQSSKNRAAYTITAELIKAGDIENIVSLPLSVFPSTGGEVHWLEWLTTRGSQVILGDYWIFPYAEGRTRSGGTKIMKKLVSSSGEPFRVDPEYAGTPGNNFIRTAILDVEDEILNVISLEIQRAVV